MISTSTSTSHIPTGLLGPYSFGAVLLMTTIKLNEIHAPSPSPMPKLLVVELVVVVVVAVVVVVVVIVVLEDNSHEIESDEKT